MDEDIIDIEKIYSDPSIRKETGATDGLKQETSLTSATLLLVGTIVGTGIFMSSSSVAQSLPSVFYFLLAWLVCGLIALLCGLCYAELGVRIPKCGGEYIYFLEIFHPLPAFSFMFTNFFFIKPVSVAILVLFFVNNLLSSFWVNDKGEVPLWPSRFICSAVTVLICILNCSSQKWSLRVNDILTYSKFGCFFILIGIAVYKMCRGEFENIKNPGFRIPVSFSKISGAIYGGMWAFDGFNNLAYAVEEMKDVKRNMVRAVIIALIVISFFYLLVNFSYVVVLGIDGVASSDSVASNIAKKYMGKWGLIVTILVSLSAFGSANGTAFCGGRIYFDAARNKHLPALLSALHKKTRTMIPSLVIQALFTIVFLLCAPNIDKLLLYFSNAAWVYYGAAIISLVVLRCRPGVDDTIFKIPLVIPIFIGILSFSFVLLGFVTDWLESLVSVSLILASIPIYYLLVHNGGFIPKCCSRGTASFTEKLCKAFSLEIPNSEKDCD